MLMGGWQRPPSSGFISQRAALAMQVVADVLEERRS